MEALFIYRIQVTRLCDILLKRGFATVNSANINAYFHWFLGTISYIMIVSQRPKINGGFIDE